ncbi:hypothetical protein HUU42_05140 [bacterium]|nr:hypothetical protein [bacterium]
MAALLIIMVPFVSYFVWKAYENQNYKRIRYLRNLSTLSLKIQDAIENYGSNVRNIYEQNFTNNKDSTHIRFEQIRLINEFIAVDIGSNTKTKLDLRTFLEIEESNPFLKTEFLRFKIKLNLGKFINYLISQHDFDYIAVFDSANRAIFQSGKNGLKIIAGDGIAELQTGRPINLDSMAQSTSTCEVQIAERSFRMFVQPLPVNLHTFENPFAPSVQWKIIGLVDKERFFNEAISISVNVALFFVGLSLFVLLSYPFLKVSLMNPDQRFSKKDSVLLIIFGPITLFVVIVFFVHLVSAMTTRADVERRVRRMADSVNGSLAEEIKQRLAFLNLNKSNYTKGNLDRNHDELKKLSRNPDFKFVYWVDGDGFQKIKWTTGKVNTPMVSLADRNYISKMIDSDEAKKSAYQIAESGEPIWIEPVLSKNQGKINTHLTIRTNDETKPVAAVVFDFQIFKKPLPADWGMAIIDSKGQVLYHTIAGRALSENFIEECGEREEIKATLLSDAARNIKTVYHGKPHEIFLRKVKVGIAGLPWYIVVYKDMSTDWSLGLDALSMTIILFLLWLVSYALIFGSIVWIRQRIMRHDFRLSWLFPDKEGDPYAYKKMITPFLGIITAGFCFLWFDNTSSTGVAFAFLIPAYSLLLVYRIVRKQRSKKTNETEPDFNVIRKSVSLAALLTLIIIMGAVAFHAKEVMAAIPLTILIGVGLIMEYHRRSTPVAHTPKNTLMTYKKVACLWVVGSVAFPYILFNQYARVIHQELSVAQKLHSFAKNSSLTHDDQVHFKRLFEIDAQTGTDRDFKNTVYALYALERHLPIYKAESVGTHVLFEPSLSAKFNMKRTNGISADSLCMSYNGIRYFAPVGSRWGWRAVAVTILGFLIVIGLGYSIISFIVYKNSMGLLYQVFVGEMRSAGPPKVRPDILHHGRNVVYIGPPRSGKSKTFEIIRIKEKTKVIDWASQERRGAAYDPPSILGEVSPAVSHIIIDHFDHMADDTFANARKINFIEWVLFEKRLHIVGITTRSPRSFTVAVPSEWIRVLGHFQINSVYSAAQLKNLLISPGDWYLSSELESGFTLQPEYKDICEYEKHFRRSQTDNVGKHLVGTVVKQNIHYYYEWIWSTLSQQEHFMLMNIAFDKSINPNNIETMITLYRKGILEFHYFPRMFSDSFAQFVATRVTQADMDAWNKEERGSTWSRFRIPFFVLGLGSLVLIVITQPAIRELSIAQISAAAGGIPAIFKLIEMLFKSRSAPATETTDGK